VVVRQYPGRPGDMAGAAGAVEAIGMFRDERANPRGDGGLVGITSGVAVKEFEEWLAVHDGFYHKRRVRRGAEDRRVFILCEPPRLYVLCVSII